MRIGVKLAPQSVDFPTLARAWAAAGASEALDSIWSFDHLYPIAGPGPCLEGWTTLAVLAHRSGSKQIGHLVLAAPYRNASLLAKMGAVMDHATDGRFVLGLGAGWHVTEAADFGLPMPGIGDRMALLEATLRSLRTLWGSRRSDSWDPPVSPQALPFEVPDAAVFLPRPRTPGGPPIWLGTSGERVGLRLVARYADGWNFSGAKGFAADVYERKRDLLRVYAAEIGRDADEITVTVQVKLTQHRDALRETAALAIALAKAGCHHLILMVDAGEGPAGVHRAEVLARMVHDSGY